MRTSIKVLFTGLALSLALILSPTLAHAQGMDGIFPNNNTGEGLNVFGPDQGNSSVDNVAVGSNALSQNTGGNGNVAIGTLALLSNTRGTGNVAIGERALFSNLLGGSNTATGYFSLFSNQNGAGNTASGQQSMQSSVSGNNNTVYGFQSLILNTVGNNNIALGFGAGEDSTGDNNIDIGNVGLDSEANTIRIGTQIDVQSNVSGADHAAHTATFIAGINGVDKSSGSPVFIDGNGQLGVGSASSLAGPQGPQGATGAQGPQGDTGAPGPGSADHKALKDRKAIPGPTAHPAPKDLRAIKE